MLLLNQTIDFDFDYVLFAFSLLILLILNTCIICFKIFIICVIT